MNEKLAAIRGMLLSNSDWILPVLPAILILAAGITALSATLIRRTARLRRLEGLIANISPAKGLEKNAAVLLELIGELLPGLIYGFYLFDKKNRNYQLKAVRHNAVDFGKVAPSYSGLKEYRKETYLPPGTLTANFGDNRKIVQLDRDGDVALATLFLSDSQALIRMGPVRGLPRRPAKELRWLAPKLDEIVRGMKDAEELKMQADVATGSSEAMLHIAQLAASPERALRMMLKTVVGGLSAGGGCLLETDGSGKLRLIDAVGIQAEALGGPGSSVWLNGQLARLQQRDRVEILETEPEFLDLPVGLAAAGAKRIVLRKFPHEHRRMTLLIWFSESVADPALDTRASNAADSAGFDGIVRELGVFLQAQADLSSFSESYQEVLKSLVRLADLQNPYTVGYSDLMAKYAIAIGQSLQLEEDEIRDIALAAYLSNIGVLGLADDLANKEGAYTAKEYELMKLHAEVGAAIVRTLIGNERLASYIHSHHERIDGNGYPEGLRGEEIPLGARIIAVVQTFLAKINGRRSRDPLPFNQALNTLEAAAGTQLDRDVVGALTGWFRDKRRNADQAKSLGYCWEMCAVPSSICDHCPVKSRPESHCWDVPGNRCAQHGKMCSACYVKTEYENRLVSGGTG